MTNEVRQQKSKKAEEGDAGEIPENAWSALQKAREITLEGIASLSDEGLRRNYLNKVEINREIITEWTQQALIREIELEEDESKPGNIQAHTPAPGWR